MFERNGKRTTRDQLKKQKPKLGYYYIVTDTEETEENFLLGLRDTMPEQLQRNLIIKVVKDVETSKLVDTAIENCSEQPQYCEPWIVFDRDEVKDFNRIIANAEENSIRVGWSNPCIEIFFYAYFGSMPVCDGSVACHEKFAQEFKKLTNKRYNKNDKQIYQRLCKFGNEEVAIDTAKKKWNEHIRNGREKPSEMSPCTTLHVLIEEIKNKITENS